MISTLKVVKCQLFQIEENNATFRRITYHSYGEHLLQYANIINNSFVTRTNGIFHVEFNCTMTLQNTIFSRNISPNVIIGTYYNSSPTLINITLDNNTCNVFSDKHIDSTINTDNIGNISTKSSRI